jgi:ribosomal protein L11 methyltransferase
VVEGIQTNIPLHRELMVTPSSSRAAPASTTWKAGWPAQALPLSPPLEGAARKPHVVELLLLRPAGAGRDGQRRADDELDALSVSVEDADADTDAEQAAVRRARHAGAARRLGALDVRRCSTTRRQARPRTLLLAQDWAVGVQCRPCRAVAEQDWVRMTQSQFAPVPITPSSGSCRAGTRCPPRQRVIRLDPGLAFGTGTHPTTRMCLRWIATAGGRAAVARACSTTAAARASWRSARRCTARAASTRSTSTRRRRATLANAQANGVTLRTGLPDLSRAATTLVLANILATPLKLLAPLLCGHVARRRPLVLAGILERQADELQAAYAPWLRCRWPTRKTAGS